MKRSRVLLAVAAVLFLAWIGWLAYLAATTTHPTVLSRPQFLVADLWVIVEVSANPTTGQADNVVTVKQLVWSATQADAKLGPKILVNNLDKMDAQHGWQGPGEYILALSRTKENTDVLQVTALPRTPGFAGAMGRIYRATPQTLRQLEQLKEEFHP